MIDPLIIDRILVLVQVVLVIGGVAVVIRAFDLAWDSVSRRRARRSLQRGQRLADRRRSWEALDEIRRHEARHIW